jgi:hypothetical protein
LACDANGSRAQKNFPERETAGEISEERSPRYRASQKKDKKTVHPSRRRRHFLGNIDS